MLMGLEGLDGCKRNIKEILEVNYWTMQIQSYQTDSQAIYSSGFQLGEKIKRKSNLGFIPIDLPPSEFYECISHKKKTRKVLISQQNNVLKVITENLIAIHKLQKATKLKNSAKVKWDKMFLTDDDKSCAALLH